MANETNTTQSAVEENNTNPIEMLSAPIDATVTATVAPDKLTGFVNMTPPENGGKEVTFEDIMAAMKEVGITFGFKEEYIKGIAEFPIYNKPVEVAFGVAPQNGTDGQVHILFDTVRKKQPKLRADDTVDFWDLDIVCNVSKGDKLVEVIKASDGVPGTDVLGNDIPAKPGKQPQTPFGKNVVFNDDKTEIYAGIDGNATFVNNQVAVDPSFRINGDVGPQTGNVNFNGDVTVSGNVKEGFSVKAAKNITIFGTVESASLDAGGNITVNGGIIGTLEDVVHCKGDLKAKFIENTTIRCEGNLTSNYITNSDVICEGEMLLSGDKASVIGGKYVVLKAITCQNIGSDNNVKTYVQLGSYGLIQEERVKCEKAFKAAEENERKVIQLIDYLNALKKQNGSLDEEKEEILKNAVQTKTKLLIEKGSLHKKIQQLDARISYEGKQELVLKGTMFHGTQLIIKNDRYAPDNDIKFTRFYYDNESEKIILGTI